MRTWALVVTLGLVASSVWTANLLANQSTAHHSSAAKATSSKKQPSTAEYKAAMDRMHSRMHIEYTCDPDLDFVAGMIPHHQGAVDMTKTQLKYGKDPEMIELAKWIQKWQIAEIEQMTHLLNLWRKNAKAEGKKDCPAKAEYEKAMEVMHRDMNIKYTGNSDIDFARGMIPHHQGAIDMAATLTRHGARPELRQLAEDIFRSQKQEIKKMQEWLDKHDTKAKK
jgi:uncharacterized protein (DUF305 family)